MRTSRRLSPSSTRASPPRTPPSPASSARAGRAARPTAGRGWAEVIDGVGEVQEALAGMARLLPEAAALYATTDETVAADSTRDADPGAGTGAS
ncbi:hypothetical protein AX769_01070 [Frondihabitans sp. PAMC 28766]|uniref:hypothetical protein n=1 Tax=Frondihabitans sp. PAMC 28766 TaxID=1795630 RepID=UPI00078E113D|nr:hypothetical protein [Frondihabitans sp. PAMC 28766]AMM18986.1 hypothetical protein AX769_01070 [Frondihabitans sp. PAMC 28766]